MTFSSLYSSCWDFIPNNAGHLFKQYGQTIISGALIREFLYSKTNEISPALLLLTYPGERVLRGLFNALKQEKSLLELHLPELPLKELIKVQKEVLEIAKDESFDLPWSLSTALHIDSFAEEHRNHHYQNQVYSLFEGGFSEIHVSIKNMYSVELLPHIKDLKTILAPFLEAELGVTFKLYNCSFEDLLQAYKAFPQARWCLATPAIELVKQFNKHQLELPALCFPSLLSKRNRDLFPRQSCAIDGFLLKKLSPLVLGPKSRRGQELLYHFDNQRSISRLKNLLPHYSQKHLIEAKSYSLLSVYFRNLEQQLTARNLCHYLNELAQSDGAT